MTDIDSAHDFLFDGRLLSGLIEDQCQMDERPMPEFTNVCYRNQGKKLSGLTGRFVGQDGQRCWDGRAAIVGIDRYCCIDRLTLIFMPTNCRYGPDSDK